MDQEPSNAVEHFSEELCRLIDRMRMEYDITYAEAVGVLEITKLDLIEESRDGC